MLPKKDEKEGVRGVRIRKGRGEYMEAVMGLHRAKKNILFVSCNGLKKIRIGRSVKKIFMHHLFGQKYVFYACFTLVGSWEGSKNFRGRDFFE